MSVIVKELQELETRVALQRKERMTDDKQQLLNKVPELLNEIVRLTRDVAELGEEIGRLRTTLEATQDSFAAMSVELEKLRDVQYIDVDQKGPDVDE